MEPILKINSNPNKSGIFNIEITGLDNLADNEVKIVDMQGRLILEQIYSGVKTLHVYFNLNAGIYIWYL